MEEEVQPTSPRSSPPQDDHSIQFEEFSLEEGNISSGKLSPQTRKDEQPLLENTVANEVNPPFWSLDYYSSFFNVDTKQVIYRLIRSLIPFPPTFLDLIKQNPDLYGPFWIASTLVFSITFSSHIARYFSEGLIFSYDVGKLSFAAAAIYGYLALVPILLSVIFQYYKISIKLQQILCIYGYSFFIYIPTSILCVIPKTFVRWILIGIACLISTSFILTNFFHALKEVRSENEGPGTRLRKGFIILTIMGAFHMGFALICQFNFFAY